MGDFLISEATDDLVDGIAGTDVGKESITQALAFRSATDQTGNIGDGQEECMVYAHPVGTIDIEKNKAEENSFYSFVKEDNL